MITITQTEQMKPLCHASTALRTRTSSSLGWTSADRRVDTTGVVVTPAHAGRGAFAPYEDSPWSPPV